MKKYITYLILAAGFFLIQCSFFPHFTMAEVVPNLMIILTASAAIIDGSLSGCLIGFICGLLIDLTYGETPGLYALGFLVIGYITGIVNRIIYKEDITLPLVVISAADFCYGLFVFAFGFMIRGRTSFLFYLRRIILPEVVYTAIIAIFLYRLILFIMLRLKGKGSENFIVKEHD